MIDDDRAIVFRPAMDDPVAHRDKIEALSFAEPLCYRGNRSRDIRYLLRFITPVDQGRFVVCLGSEPRLGTYPVDLTFDEPFELTITLNSKYLELDARRAGIDDQDRIHDASRRRHGRGAPAGVGIEHRDRAGGHAAAHRIRARG